ncbi:MAG: plasmid stabilization protein [Neorhizobium sp.]|nr:plasmid stabilization protein [Neorhizobium sp.]
MGDLLIRNVDGALKQELQNRARRNGHSLPDEAVALVRTSLDRPQHNEQPACTWIRGLVGKEWFSDDDLATLEAARHVPDRSPPTFGE